MDGQIGKNTPNAEKLRGFVDELERIEGMKADLGQQKRLIMERAKSDGFDTKAIGYLLKVRKMKPHDRADAETLRDVYLHAMDMAPELPLFRQVAALVDDAASEDKVLAALKHLAPATGDIIMRMGGKQLRIYRDTNGLACVEPYVEAKPKAELKSGSEPRERREVPDVTPEVAFELGEAAALGNFPVIDNPFPYGDPRRAQWDAGWRKGAGGDGFGG
jgi:uncharacterized protein (UPF0335 family)